MEGSTLPDFTPLLAQAGLTLRRADPERAWLGADRVTVDGSAVSLGQAPAQGTPLYLAGVDAGDQLIALGRTTLGSAAEWALAVGRLKSGEQVQIHYRQRGLERTAMMRAVSDPKLEIVRSETTGQTLTAKQRAFRASWLAGE